MDVRASDERALVLLEGLPSLLEGLPLLLEGLPLLLEGLLSGLQGEQRCAGAGAAPGGPGGSVQKMGEGQERGQDQGLGQEREQERGQEQEQELRARALSSTTSC